MNNSLLAYLKLSVVLTKLKYINFMIPVMLKTYFQLSPLSILVTKTLLIKFFSFPFLFVAKQLTTQRISGWVINCAKIHSNDNIVYI